MTNNFSIILKDDKKHNLLEPPLPPYSKMTVQRAFIVWLHCGQLNDFKHVCNYFHNLEDVEEEMSFEARLNSRLLEFDLLAGSPPTSMFLFNHFPDLYRPNPNHSMDLNPLSNMNIHDCIFNLQGFHELRISKGMTSLEMERTSVIIRRYCTSHSITLKSFLKQFLDFTKYCKRGKSIHNIAIYVKKKLLKDELEIYRNMPRNFSFLEHIDAKTEPGVANAKAEVTKTSIDAKNNSKVIKNPYKMKKLIKAVRRVEFVDLTDENPVELPADGVQYTNRLSPGTLYLR